MVLGWFKPFKPSAAGLLLFVVLLGFQAVLFTGAASSASMTPGGEGPTETTWRYGFAGAVEVTTVTAPGATAPGATAPGATAPAPPRVTIRSHWLAASLLATYAVAMAAGRLITPERRQGGAASAPPGRLGAAGVFLVTPIAVAIMAWRRVRWMRLTRTRGFAVQAKAQAAVE